MIPAGAYAGPIQVLSGMVATRRGEHWKIGEREAAELGAAIAGVMKYVPLPDRELGIAGDVAALAAALYMTIAPRIELDRQAAARIAPPIAAPEPSSTSAPTTVGERDMPVHDRDGAAILEGLGDLPLVGRAQGGVVGELPVQPGPRDPLAFDADPERALFERTQPVGAESATVGELVELSGGGVPLLDRLAPAPDVAV